MRDQTFTPPVEGDGPYTVIVEHPGTERRREWKNLRQAEQQEQELVVDFSP